MSEPAVDTCAEAYHLSVVVMQQGRPVGYRVLDMRGEYPILTKELACRAVAAHPGAAGRSWVPRLRMEAAAPRPHVVMEAHLAGGGLVAAMSVPAANFFPIAAGIAAQVNVEGEYKYCLAVHSPDSVLVADWNATPPMPDDDFEITTPSEPRLTLPSGFAAGDLPQPRRVIDPADSWLRCVFRRRAFDELLDAAARETDIERSWIGLGSVHVSPHACHVVVDEGLVELPGEAGREWIITHGRDWARLHDRIGDRLVAYLHLHPRTVEGRKILPQPSRNDAVLAWNVDMASARPVVFPIAMFGADGASPNGDVAVYGYMHGLLTRAQLEVAS